MINQALALILENGENENIVCFIFKTNKDFDEKLLAFVSIDLLKAKILVYK